MLEWHHDKRATAQEMLEHPWLNMEPNYDYKFTKKEYEKLQFKKEMQKNQVDPFAEDAKLEMGELIDSDPELYGGDSETKPSGKRRDMIGNNHDLNGHHDLMRGGGGDPWDCLYDSDDNNSLIDPEEQEVLVKSQKKKGVKLNNSFTGPYPQDPTDFNHTDKGANAQFAYYNKLKKAK